MRWNLRLFLGFRRMRNRIHIDISGNIAYNDYTITELLLKNLYWAGRKTWVHQMAGKTPAFLIFLWRRSLRDNKIIAIRNNYEYNIDTKREFFSWL